MPSIINLLLEEVKKSRVVQESLLKSANNQDVKLAKIEEHLKAMNGTIAWHEKGLCTLSEENIKQWVILNKHIQEDAKQAGEIQEWKKATNNNINKIDNWKDYITRQSLIKGGVAGGGVSIILSICMYMAKFILT